MTSWYLGLIVASARRSSAVSAGPTGPASSWVSGTVDRASRCRARCTRGWSVRALRRYQAASSRAAMANSQAEKPRPFHSKAGMARQARSKVAAVTSSATSREPERR